MRKILSAILIIAFTSTVLTACDNKAEEQKKALEKRKESRGTRNLANGE